jgi:protein-tyrosine kinase
MSVVERALHKMRGDPRGVRGTPLSDTQIRRNLGALEPRQVAEDSGEARSKRRLLIDREAMREAGYLPEADLDRRFADHYRQIKRPLIAAALAAGDDPRGGVIMMASALPGDGKTFTSINLALSMARERDTSVVLVDADVAKPHVSRMFGIDGEPGLLDALADSSLDIESMILATDVPGLAVLPAGKSRDNAAELLASTRMTQLVARVIANDPRRLMLFDTAPILVSSEARAMVSVAGQVLLVVRAMHTPRQAVLDALGRLGKDCNVKLVLNEERASVTKGYYGQDAYGSYGDVPTG